jgi:hypothetical protein
MHHALDYLSSHLVLPRIEGTTLIQPFTITHPLPTLSISLTHGFSLPARLALKEVVNATNSIWDAALDDAQLDSLALDFRTLKKILRMRNSRADAYKGFIENLQSYSHVNNGFGQRPFPFTFGRRTCSRSSKKRRMQPHSELHFTKGGPVIYVVKVWYHSIVTHSKPLSPCRLLRSVDCQSCVKRVYHQDIAHG